VRKGLKILKLAGFGGWVGAYLIDFLPRRQKDTKKFNHGLTRMGTNFLDMDFTD
jgi:hypothetical protein